MSNVAGASGSIDSGGRGGGGATFFGIDSLSCIGGRRSELADTMRERPAARGPKRDRHRDDDEHGREGARRMGDGRYDEGAPGDVLVPEAPALDTLRPELR